MSLDKLRSQDWQPYLNQVFCIQLQGVAPIELELAQVTDLGAAEDANSARRRPFSLQFLGPVSDQYLLQHIYRLEHAQMGALEIFLVPLGLQGQRMRYEAIFA
jgi:hypothetical protein